MFATPISGGPDTLPEERRQPLVHPRGLVEITGLRLTLRSGEPISDVVRVLHQAGIALFETGNDHLAEIEFDHGSQNRSADFRPLLPLRFRG